MRHTLTRHLQRLLPLLAATAAVGWMFGYPLAALTIALSLYLAWTLLQLGRLQH